MELRDIATELTRRGYAITQTGGGCKAWVKRMDDGQDVVVTDMMGCETPEHDDWIVGRYEADDWTEGNTTTSNEGEHDTLWDAIFITEASPYVRA